jgi:hypothetical protein
MAGQRRGSSGRLHPDEGPIGAELLPITAERDASGHLSVGGVDLVALADRMGTPLFVYDEAHLRARCREAVTAWGDGVAYATKAFLCARPWPVWPTKRACGWTSRRVASCTSP